MRISANSYHLTGSRSILLKFMERVLIASSVGAATVEVKKIMAAIDCTKEELRWRRVMEMYTEVLVRYGKLRLYHHRAEYVIR